MNALIFFKKKGLIFISMSLIGVLSVLAVSAVEQGLTDQAIRINADTMISRQEENQVEFSGNVVAATEDSVIHADQIIIHLYTENEKDKLKVEKKQNVRKITAIGHVKYISGQRKAFSDRAVYTTKDKTLVLTGTNPKVMTGENFISGKKIIFFQAEGRIFVESGKEKRVEALFNTTDKTD
ncbi:MAG: LptA/OstA family protein [Thermodesulfobacteriota bacterium]|nr:LptA/OstA family protein [Thermodesulfobacteriota bacterium]